MKTPQFNVISMDYERISVVKKNGVHLVIKKTEKKERNNIYKITRWLGNGKLFCISGTEDVVNIKVPKIYGWNGTKNEIYLEYCEGDNLEERLKDFNENRWFYLNILKSFIAWMKEEGFFWEDAAPRNLIFNKSQGILYMVDFESDLYLGNAIMTKEEFSLFCQGIVLEEMSALLMEEEQKEIFHGVWNYLPKKAVESKTIKSTRRLELIRVLKGVVPEIIEPKLLIEVEKLILGVAIPFKINDNVFFPLLALEEVKGAEKYVDTIFELIKNPKNRWPEIIAKRSR